MNKLNIFCLSSTAKFLAEYTNNRKENLKINDAQNRTTGVQKQNEIGMVILDLLAI